MNNNSRTPKIRFKGFTNDWKQRKFGDILKTDSFKAYLAVPSPDGKYKVIQQGDNPVVGYATGKPYQNYEDVVLFGDHTLSLYKPRSPFFVATDGLKILSGAVKTHGNYLNQFHNSVFKKINTHPISNRSIFF